MADDGNSNDRSDGEIQKSEKMFSLKKWNAVAMWSWDVECDTCAICRVQVMDFAVTLYDLQQSPLNIVYPQLPRITCLSRGQWNKTSRRVNDRSSLMRLEAFLSILEGLKILVAIRIETHASAESAPSKSEYARS
ncbi:hypothetical protein B566_EDAN002234 [Ephemera danica]|nr:hypothetical protein B566_EDAN002234 [Ephemera danica]